MSSMSSTTPTSEAIRDLLARSRHIAVVGLSPKPERDSYRVAAYLQRHGYTITPVRPGQRAILGEPCHPSVAAVPPERPVEIVDLFRRSELVGPHVDEAIARGGVRAIWMQVGITDETAARRARDAGILVVMDRCLMVDHAALIGG